MFLVCMIYPGGRHIVGCGLTLMARVLVSFPHGGKLKLVWWKGCISLRCGWLVLVTSVVPDVVLVLQVVCLDPWVVVTVGW